MKKLIIFLITAGFVLTFFMGGLKAEMDEVNIQERISLETRLETRLKSIISEIVGSDRIVVAISVQLVSKEKKKSLESLVKKKKKESTIILPGVPAKDRLDKSQDSFPTLAPLTFTETQTSIKKIKAAIILDKSIDETSIPIVRSVASTVLRINTERGDELSVERYPFHGYIFNWKDMLKPPDVYKAGALALGLLIFFFGFIFFFGPLRGFFSNVITYLNTAAEKSGEPAVAVKQELHGAKGGPMGGSGFGGGGGGGLFGGGAGGSRPFSFINESHINDLVYLMKQAPIEGIAIVVNYINPVLASRLLGSLDNEIQAKVTEILAKTQEFTKQNIKGVEDMLKNKLDYLVGGEERLTNLVGFLDKETQTKVLMSLSESHGDIADRIKKTIFNFESLVTLEPRTVQMIIRNINPAVFAQVLKSTDADFQRKIFDMLSEGQAERVQQEMDMAKPLTKKRIEDEKRVVVNLVKSFEQQGIIELNK